MKLYQDLTRGFNDLHTITWPISATDRAYTYTFPLPDAPIVDLRLHPPSHGVTLFIETLRIIDRRGTEVRRFTLDMCVDQEHIAAILPQERGWSITSIEVAHAPAVRLALPAPILAQGIHGRNFLRCLLSTGYLALMLWIILLAVLFACWRPTRWRDLAAPVAFMAFLALSFAPVGNRGLIRDSVFYTRYVAPTPPPLELRLEFDLNAPTPSPTMLFWDIGHGIRGEDHLRLEYQEGSHEQTLRFPLPLTPLQGLRFDPRDNPGKVIIHGIRVVDGDQRTRLLLPLDSFVAVRDVETLEIRNRSLRVITTPDARDPILEMKPEALAALNHAITAALAARP